MYWKDADLIRESAMSRRLGAVLARLLLVYCSVGVKYGI